MDKGKYYAYIVQCKDGTFYTGWTNNLDKRMKAHNQGKQGAKYTRSRRPVTLVYYETFDTQEEAMSREWYIKQLTRKEKEELIQNFKVIEEREDNYMKELWKPGNMLYPLPAVMVTCKRENEKTNIITIAWTGTVCSSPAMVSISVRPERYSYDIMKETGEFVINLVTEELTYAADYCGVKSGRDIDKFKEMKLHECPGQKVSVPGIMESPVNIECKVKEIIPLGSHDLFLAEVVGVQVENSYMDENGKFNLNSSGLMTYSHGEYFTLGKKLGKFGYSVKKR